MKKIIFSLLVLSFAASAVNAQKTFNDPDAVKVDVKSFHAINVSNAFNVYISQGNEDAVAVSASDEKFRENIKVEVEKGVLKIYYEKKGFLKGMSCNKMKLTAYISFKDIEMLTVSGACDVFLEGGIKADQFTIKMSGASDLKGKLDVKKLDVDISGASDVKVSGSASQLKIEASGASDFKGYDLATDFCNVTVSGASSIEITVNKELSAHASGASDIYYKGEGIIREIKSTGASSVSKKS